MIAKFNTPKINVTPISKSKGGGSGVKTVLTVVSVVGLGYLAYKYWWIPKNEHENKTKNG